MVDQNMCLEDSGRTRSLFQFLVLHASISPTPPQALLSVFLVDPEHNQLIVVPK